MSLLDDILAQVAGGGGGRAAEPRDAAVDTTASPGSGSGMSQVMVALLPVVLGMLSNTQQGRSTGAQQGTLGGGAGDILGQILGGTSGGLGGLLEQFQRAGFGEQARSWVSTGRNLPMPPDALGQVLGRGGLAEIARRAGVSERDASEGLSQLMPEVVDRVTPEGRVPDSDVLLASVQSFIKRLGPG